MDALVKEGIELNRHYVHMMCTPTRASFQSGRLPVHVLTRLSSPCDENGAIPRNMTGIAAQLKTAGYGELCIYVGDLCECGHNHTTHRSCGELRCVSAMLTVCSVSDAPSRKMGLRDGHALAHATWSWVRREFRPVSVSRGAHCSELALSCCPLTLRKICCRRP